jgi:hypothetical protein
MSSQKQIEANRLNSRKSTGPRSAEGKSLSRLNALKSGIHAESQIIRGENAFNLEVLQIDYYDRFQPTTPEQRMLVDSLIDAEWLLRRFRVSEAQLWEQGVQYSTVPNDGMELGRAFRKNSDHFARLQRRVDSAHKNFRNALRELQRLQAEEAALNANSEPDSAPQPDPPTPRNQSVTLPNGFVPQAVPPHLESTSKRRPPVDTENSIL